MFLRETGGEVTATGVSYQKESAKAYHEEGYRRASERKRPTCVPPSASFPSKPFLSGHFRSAAGSGDFHRGFFPQVLRQPMEKRCDEN